MSAFTDKVVSQCLTDASRTKGTGNKGSVRRIRPGILGFGLKKKGIDGRRT
jgi:hypothetical protein